jgi:hypothetical protein
MLLISDKKYFVNFPIGSQLKTFPYGGGHLGIFVNMPQVTHYPCQKLYVYY